MTQLLAHCCNQIYLTIRGYITKIENNQVLRQHIQSGIAQYGLAQFADQDIHGKRLGWYAVVRTLKPKINAHFLLLSDN